MAWPSCDRDNAVGYAIVELARATPFDRTSCRRTRPRWTTAREGEAGPAAPERVVA